MARVFISHAIKDKKLVDKFFDLLQTGAGLNAKDTFCSSLEGMGIPKGEDFLAHIKAQIENPELVILILSPNYMDSVFCVCEMGASWAMSHNILPVVVPPLDFASIGPLVKGIQGTRIEDKIDLTEFKDKMVEVLNLDEPNNARWEAKRDEFLTVAKRITKKLDKPATINRVELEALQLKYDAQLEGIGEKDEAIARLEEELETVKSLKDKEEIIEHELSHSDDWTKFDALCGEIASHVEHLPSAVIESAFQQNVGGNASPEQQQVADLNAAVQRGLLEEEDFSLVSDAPKISRLTDSLDNLSTFLSKVEYALEENGFWEQFAEKHDYHPRFTNRNLWEDFLGLQSHTQWS